MFVCECLLECIKFFHKFSVCVCIAHYTDDVSNFPDSLGDVSLHPGSGGTHQETLEESWGGGGKDSSHHKGGNHRGVGRISGGSGGWSIVVIITV